MDSQILKCWEVMRQKGRVGGMIIFRSSAHHECATISRLSPNERCQSGSFFSAGAHERVTLKPMRKASSFDGKSLNFEAHNSAAAEPTSLLVMLGARPVVWVLTHHLEEYTYINASLIITQALPPGVIISGTFLQLKDLGHRKSRFFNLHNLTPVFGQLDCQIYGIPSNA